MPYSTDIKDYYRRAWGLEDRPKFKYGGSWADWMTNFSDQMTFEEYLRMDIKTKKPHALDEKADGGRIGQLVQPSTDGSRPGYAGKEDPYIFTLKGRHAKKKYYHLLITDRTGGETKTIVKKMLEATPTNLKKLRKLRDQKVKEHWPNRISDEKFRELRTSDKYKNLNNEDFAEVLKGKKYKTKFGRDWSIDTIQSKQQDLKLLGKVGYKPATLTPEKEVLDIMKTIREGPERVKEYIKAGRPEKMLENFRTRVAQKVHYEKYGATPERLARSLEWRLRNPEKIKVQSMKRFAGTGLFPNGANYKEHLWRDLWRSSQTKAGERFKFVSELPPLKKTKAGTQVRDWLKDDYYKTIKFKDTKTGKIINFNNLQKYLDQTMGEGTYAKSISGYELKDTLKNQKITYKGKTGTIGGLLKQNLYSPKQLAKQKLLSPLHMQHPGGVGKNWWVNEVVFSDANLGLRDLDSTLTGKLKRAKGFTKKKALLQKYAKDVEKLPGGITSVLRSKTYGKTPTPTSVMKAAGKEAGLKGKNWNKAMSGTFQSLSPRSIAQLSKIHGCGKKQEGGSIMSCLKGKFNKAPEKFLQRSAPLAKDNVNLFKWFKNGRKIARGTGVFAAWEAAFAPLVAGWMATEGESGVRMLNEIAYGVPFIGETEKEEWMKYADGDEKAYAMKKMGELEEQEIPYLQYQLEQAQAKSAGTKEKVPGYTSYHEKEILEDIKEKEQEYQGYINNPEFWEGPTGKYINESVAMDAFNLADATTAKIAADKAARKEDYKIEPIFNFLKRGYENLPRMAGGGITNLKIKW